MQDSVKMTDIAMKLGISTVSVSNALSGKPGVSRELREKILETAREMGYHRKKTSTEKVKGFLVGILISQLYVGNRATFYWKLYHETSMALKKANGSSIYEIVKTEDEAEKRLPLCVENGKCDALICLGKLDGEYLKFLKKHWKRPIVFLDFYERSLLVDSVISNGYYGTYFLTEFLIQKGHRKIAYVGSITASPSIMDRYMGYCRALFEYDMEPKAIWRLEDRDITTGRLGISTLPEPMPTAFVCNSDLTANILINKLQDNGYSVPRDVSVTGFDNYADNNSLVEVTTYDVDCGKMAQSAVACIQRQMDDQYQTPTLLVTDGHLVIKDSVAEPKEK